MAYRPPTPITPDPVAYPALAAPRYDRILMYGTNWGQRNHLQVAIRHDDVPAVHEFFKLRPDLLTAAFWDNDAYDDGGGLLFHAAAGGRPEVLKVLLDYRGAVSRKADETETSNRPRAGPRQGTPLTGACQNAQIDALKILLGRMDNPDDVNQAGGSHGLTPLLMVAACSHDNTRYVPCILQGKPVAGYHSNIARLGVQETSARSVEALRLLLQHGADPRAVRLQLRDAWGQDMHYPSDSYPGEYGNALVLALERTGTLRAQYYADSDMAVVQLLLDEAGVDVHQGAILPAARLDGLGNAGCLDPPEHPGGNNTNDTDGDERRRDTGPMHGELAYLTPLAVAALHHNVPGLKALLALSEEKKADFTQDLVDPVMAIPGVENLENPANNDHELLREIVPMRPLHAAALGLASTYHWGPRIHGEVRPPSEDNPMDDLCGAAEEAKAYWRYAKEASETLRLLTADPAICAATINATHKGYTPLHLVARFDRIPMLQVLLERGADPSIRVPSVGSGRNSVFYHVFVSSLPRLQLSGQAPYHTTHARMVDHDIYMFPFIRDLLKQPGENDPDVVRRDALELLNEADADGNTALHWAMGFGLPRTVTALINYGARVDVQNNAGEIPRRGIMPTTTRRETQEAIRSAMDGPYEWQEYIARANNWREEGI